MTKRRAARAPQPFHDFQSAWWWVYGHPIYRDPILTFDGHFKECLDIHVAEVDPKTRRVMKDRARNTHTEVWLESGPWEWPADIEADDPALFPQLGEMTRCFGRRTHDYSLDCGADTFEEAIIKLAKRVRHYYGDYDPSIWDITDAEAARTRRSPGLQGLFRGERKPRVTTSLLQQEKKAIADIEARRLAARKAAFAQAARVRREEERRRRDRRRAA